MSLVLYCFAVFAAIMILIYIAAGFTIFYVEPEEKEATFYVDSNGKLKIL